MTMASLESSTAHGSRTTMASSSRTLNNAGYAELSRVFKSYQFYSIGDKLQWQDYSIKFSKCNVRPVYLCYEAV